MKRLRFLAIPALFAGGWSTESHLLDPVHTPLVGVSPERSEDARESAELRLATPADRQQRVMGPWP